MNDTVEQLERRFEAGEATRLFVHNPFGAISVAPSSDQAIHVRVPDYDPQEFDDNPIHFAHEGSAVTVRVREHAELDVQLAVPRHCSVELSTSSGDVNVHGLEGALQIKSTDGAVSLHDVRGSISVRTADGDISLHGAHGDVDLGSSDGGISAHDLHAALRASNANGDITIQRSQLVRLSLEAQNGDVEMESALVPGAEYLLNVANGDTRILVPARTQADVTLRSQNGEIEVHVPADAVERTKRSWKGQLNGGGAKLVVTSANGEIRVDRSTSGLGIPESTPWTPATPVEPATPLDPATPPDPVSPVEPFSPVEATSPAEADATSSGVGKNDATISILAQLERGEITVEEAMSSLDSLG